MPRESYNHQNWTLPLYPRKPCPCNCDGLDMARAVPSVPPHSAPRQQHSIQSISSSSQLDSNVRFGSAALPYRTTYSVECLV